MVDTAGTLVKAAEVLKEKGATSVMACCTHGVLSGPAYDRVANGVLDELVISDTIKKKKNAKKMQKMYKINLSFIICVIQHCNMSLISSSHTLPLLSIPKSVFQSRF